MDSRRHADKQRYKYPTPNSSSNQRLLAQSSQSPAWNNATPTGSMQAATTGSGIGYTSFQRAPPMPQYHTAPYGLHRPFPPTPMPLGLMYDHHFGHSIYQPVPPAMFNHASQYFSNHNNLPGNAGYGAPSAQNCAQPFSREHFEIGIQRRSDQAPIFSGFPPLYQASATDDAAFPRTPYISGSGSVTALTPLTSATARPQGSTCRLHLYGPSRPSVNIAGSREALQKLQRATVVEGLVVKQQIYGNDRSVFNASLKSHQERGSWPTAKQSLALDRMSEDELLRFGITPDDYKIPEGSSIYLEGQPPYRTKDLNLDGLLVLLRIMAKYHDSGSPDGPRIWALGIVDKFMDNTFQAKLFPAEDNPSTHELWFLREVIGPDDDFVEVWRPFVMQSTAPLEKEAYTRPTPKHLWKNKDQDGDDSDDGLEPGARSPHPMQKSKPRNLRRYNHKTARWSQYKHLSWEEILDEGKIPIEDFCGEVMLEVAARFSNKEIALRTNVWRAQATSENLVWQVIKKALTLRAGTTHAYKEAYKQFEDVRVRNNVKRKEQAGRKSRIGIAPTRRDSAFGRSRKSSSREIVRQGKRKSSDVTLLSTVTDDLPTFTGIPEGRRSHQRHSDSGDAEGSDDDAKRASAEYGRKLRKRKAMPQCDLRLDSLADIKEEGEMEIKAEGGQEEDDVSAYEEEDDEEDS